MAKFILVYRGKATDMSDMTEEQQAKVMEGWKSWMGKVGSALTDVGNPFGPGAGLVDDGSIRDANALSGFSIVEASDLDAARKLADGHPYLSEGKGNYGIDIYELIPAPL